MTDKREWRVWFEQVNQCYVDVVAEKQEQAIEKAYRKWRREYGHTHATYIETID